SFRPAILDRDVPAFEITCLAETLQKRTQDRCCLAGRSRAQEPDHRHRLLRARQERPRGRAAEERDERAPPHSITSSARASSVAGTSRPRALAVFRLMRSSMVVGNSIGRSPGFAPFRILSTNAALRRDPILPLIP